MTRSLPFLALALMACGPKGELIRYTVDVSINDVPPWLDASSAGTVYEVAPCDNAEVFDQTLRVYDGNATDAVAAIRFRWTGFDLSDGGENQETHFLAKGETLEVLAALKPDTVLYEIDHKGRMFQVDRDVAKVSGKDTANGAYTLGEGEGIQITEVHEVAKEVDAVDFIEQAEVWACDSTQL